MNGMLAMQEQLPAAHRSSPSEIKQNIRLKIVLTIQRGEMMSSEQEASERGEGKFWAGSLQTVNDPPKDFSSPAIAPAFPVYRPSMDINEVLAVRRRCVTSTQKERAPEGALSVI